LKAAFCAVVHNKRRAIRENDAFLLLLFFTKKKSIKYKKICRSKEKLMIFEKVLKCMSVKIKNN